MEVGRFGRQRHQQMPEYSRGTRLKHRDKHANSTRNQQILLRIYTLQYPSVGSTCSEMSNMRTSNPPQSQIQKKHTIRHKKCCISSSEPRSRPSADTPHHSTSPHNSSHPRSQWHATASSGMNYPKDHCRRNPETCRHGVHNARPQAHPGCPRSDRFSPVSPARPAMPQPFSDFANLWSVE